jgi:hypothetical protein
MKLKLNLFLIVLLFLPAIACNSITIGNTIRGSGNIITKDYDVSGFNGVTLAGFGDVYITQGETEELSVETDDNLFDQLDIQVRGDELILSMKPNVNLDPSKSIIYHLTVKDLNNITLAGSGNIYSDPIQTSDMKILLAGSGNIEVKGLSGDGLDINLAGSGNITVEQIDVTSVDTSINGSGDIRLDGKADHQTIKVNGSGSYSAGDLETAKADISIAGSGNLTVWVTDELDIHVNGSGDVSYYGRPAVNQSGNGSGKVKSLGEK